MYVCMYRLPFDKVSINYTFLENDFLKFHYFPFSVPYFQKAKRYAIAKEHESQPYVLLMICMTFRKKLYIEYT